MTLNGCFKPHDAIFNWCTLIWLSTHQTVASIIAAQYFQLERKIFSSICCFFSSAARSDGAAHRLTRAGLTTSLHRTARLQSHGSRAGPLEPHAEPVQRGRQPHRIVSEPSSTLSSASWDNFICKLASTRLLGAEVIHNPCSACFRHLQSWPLCIGL
jgi:hypothetical protein